MISVVQKNELKKNLSLFPYDDDQYLIFNIYTRFKYPDKHINIHINIAAIIYIKFLFDIYTIPRYFPIGVIVISTSAR